MHELYAYAGMRINYTINYENKYFASTSGKWEISDQKSDQNPHINGILMTTFGLAIVGG